MPNTTVSLVVPTFNGRETLAKNIQAMEACLRQGDELVVIDDASTDDTFSWLSERYQLTQFLQKNASTAFSQDSWAGASYWVGTVTKNQLRVLVIVNKDNARFGAAVNRAVRAAQSPYILLLNSDVIPSADLISQMLPHFVDSLMFAIGCHEHESHHQDQSAGKNCLWFERGMYRHSKAATFTTGETAWVSGGSGLFDRTKWLTLGGFDSLYYPAYWEDIDLSMRARLRGWKIWFEAAAEVIHDHETTNQTAFGQEKIIKMSWENARRFTWRHAKGWQWIQALIWTPYNWWQRWKMSKTLQQN